MQEAEPEKEEPGRHGRRHGQPVKRRQTGDAPLHEAGELPRRGRSVRIDVRDDIARDREEQIDKERKTGGLAPRFDLVIAEKESLGVVQDDAAGRNEAEQVQVQKFTGLRAQRTETWKSHYCPGKRPACLSAGAVRQKFRLASASFAAPFGGAGAECVS